MVDQSTVDNIVVITVIRLTTRYPKDSIRQWTSHGSTWLFCCTISVVLTRFLPSAPISMESDWKEMQEASGYMGRWDEEAPEAWKGIYTVIITNPTVQTPNSTDTPRSRQIRTDNLALNYNSLRLRKCKGFHNPPLILSLTCSKIGTICTISSQTLLEA